MSHWHALEDSQVLNDEISIIGRKQTRVDVYLYKMFEFPAWVSSKGEKSPAVVVESREIH